MKISNLSLLLRPPRLNWLTSLHLHPDFPLPYLPPRPQMFLPSPFPLPQASPPPRLNWLTSPNPNSLTLTLTRQNTLPESPPNPNLPEPPQLNWSFPCSCRPSLLPVYPNLPRFSSPLSPFSLPNWSHRPTSPGYFPEQNFPPTPSCTRWTWSEFFPTSPCNWFYGLCVKTYSLVIPSQNSHKESLKMGV